jgi:VanZ family protein
MKVTGALFQRGQRVAAWSCLGAIGILSLLPAADVAPWRTSMGAPAEHLLAYAATTLITAFAYVDHGRLKITLALILYAAALEYLQRYAPGRLSSFEGLAFSATGIIIGVATVHVIEHIRARRASADREM